MHPAEAYMGFGVQVGTGFGIVGMIHLSCLNLPENRMIKKRIDWLHGSGLQPLPGSALGHGLGMWTIAKMLGRTAHLKQLRTAWRH